MGDDIPLPLLKGFLVAMLTRVDLQKPRTRLERPGDFLAVIPPVMFPTSFFTITMCRLLHFRNELSTANHWTIARCPRVWKVDFCVWNRRADGG